MNNKTANPARPFSPFVLTKDVTLPRAQTFQVVANSKLRPATANSTLDSSSRQHTDMEVVSDLPRRLSLHGSTITDISPSVHVQDDRIRPTIMAPTPEDLHYSPSPSAQLSATKFSEPPFQLISGDDDGLDDDSLSEPHTPPPAPTYSQRLESVHGRASSHSSNSDSDLRVLLPARPETPFVDSVVPTKPWLLALEGDAVVRRERKQGWSGEWNREDMQDVIKTLRSLK